MLCITILVLFAFYFAGVDMETTFAKYQKSVHNNSKVDPHMLRYKNFSIPRCAVMCQRTDKCLALNYNANGTCEMSQYKPSDQNASLVVANGWSIYLLEQQGSFPNGYDGFVLDGRGYFWQQSNKGMNWTNCLDQCRTHGADIVCISGKEWNSAYRATAIKRRMLHFWVDNRCTETVTKTILTPGSLCMSYSPGGNSTYNSYCQHILSCTCWKRLN